MVAGDGRHDSMGHSAKFGAYTIFCCTLPMIIHFALIQVMKKSSFTQHNRCCYCTVFMTTLFRQVQYFMDEHSELSLFFFINARFWFHNLDKHLAWYWLGVGV